MEIQRILTDRDLILTEAAVVESLRRAGDVRLDPRLEHALLIYEAAGKIALSKLYDAYITESRKGGIPIFICTPTWRANKARLSSAQLTKDVNGDAVTFLKHLKAKWGSWAPNIFIGGLIGCKNDCYKPDEGLSKTDAKAFHAWQISKLANTRIDFLIGATMPALPEATGMALAMAETHIPYIISFVINREGRILDGNSLATCFGEIDAACPTPPLGFMINCSYPSFLNPHKQPKSVLSRLIGFQANASSLDHAKLDGAKRLQADDMSDWGRRLIELNQHYGIKILGGCCGTGPEHLQYIVENIGRTMQVED